MTSRDHERFRRQLEEQLRADAQLLYAAYCAKLRAYETLHRLQGELGDLDPRLLLPADLPLSLPAGFCSVSGHGSSLPMGFPVADCRRVATVPPVATVAVAARGPVVH